MSLSFRSSRRLALVLLLVGCGAAALYWKLRPSPATAAYERGKMLAAAKLPQDAWAVYEEAIRLDPRFAPPYRALAEIASEQKDTPSALRYWQEYLDRAPNAEHGWCRLAGLKLDTGLEVPALRDAERELKQAPDCGRAHLVAGLVYEHRSVAKPALEHLAQAIRAYPDQPRVQLAYGRVLALSGDYGQAAQVLEKIVQKDSARPEPFRWLGYVYARRPYSVENVRQAEQNLLHALQLKPDYAEVSYELGNLYAMRKQYPKALPYAEKATTRKHYPQALYLLAQVYEGLGRHADSQRAQQAFRHENELMARQQALLKQYRVDMGNVEIALELSKVLLARDEPRLAVLYLSDAARHAPNDSRLQAALAAAQKQLQSPSANEH